MADSHNFLRNSRAPIGKDVKYPLILSALFSVYRLWENIFFCPYLLNYSRVNLIQGKHRFWVSPRVVQRELQKSFCDEIICSFLFSSNFCHSQKKSINVESNRFTICYTYIRYGSVKLLFQMPKLRYNFLLKLFRHPLCYYCQFFKELTINSNYETLGKQELLMW